MDDRVEVALNCNKNYALNFDNYNCNLIDLMQQHSMELDVVMLVALMMMLVDDYVENKQNCAVHHQQMDPEHSHFHYG